MYTYYDMLWDEDGNAIVTNYTDADTSCGDILATADVTLSMSSGYSQYASASGACCAEAVALVPLLELVDEITASGSNEVQFGCGEQLNSSFIFRGKKVTLMASASTCSRNPVSGYVDLYGYWGELGACGNGENKSIGVATTGCMRDSEGRACYYIQTGGCSDTWCVGKERYIDCSTLRFRDKFPIQQVSHCIY